MTVHRAAAYIGVIALLCAWLASAASTARRAQPSSSTPQPGFDRSATELIAQDVQAQAGRLRKRLASAPVPQQPTRNPFAFRPRESAPRPIARGVAAPLFQPLRVDEPALVLIGVAEHVTPGGPVRTAMIAGEADQLFIVKAGEIVMGRYHVEIVGTDVVQLKDLAGSGGLRRLVLQ